MLALEETRCAVALGLDYPSHVGSRVYLGATSASKASLDVAQSLRCGSRSTLLTYEGTKLLRSDDSGTWFLVHHNRVMETISDGIVPSSSREIHRRQLKLKEEPCGVRWRK